MITFNIITLFPELFAKHLEVLPFKKALDKKLIKVNLYDLRTFALDKHKTVDDKPYGGGKGMILMVEPLYKALKKIPSKTNTETILLAPSGKRYTQKTAQNLAKKTQITLICGRYEGVDARVEKLTTKKISIGDYILSGGELPALVVMESVIRLIPGILDKVALQKESFCNDTLEYPQYTRPENFKGMRVPKVLLSGHHENIEVWNKKHTKKVIPLQ